MNKPKTIYAIAIWSFLQTGFYVAIPVGMIGKLFTLSPELSGIIKVCALTGSIIIIVGLIQLKRIPRIVSVILLSVASLIILKIFITLFFIDSGHSLRSYISFTTMLSINIICIWYLLRKKFIDFSSEYRKHVDLKKRLIVSV